MSKKLISILFLTLLFLSVTALPFYVVAAPPEQVQRINTIYVKLLRMVGSNGIQMEGNSLILDTNRDTTITADTVGQIDFEVGGTDVLTLDSSGLAVASGGITVTSGGLTVTAGGLTVTSGGLTVNGGLTTLSGGLNFTPQTEVVTTAFVITPTSGIVSLSSTIEVTSSATTGIITTTATNGDVIILANNNASDRIWIDGVGGTVECKADVILGASDTLTLWYNEADLVWNCLSNFDNS